MEGDLSNIGHRGARITMNNGSYDNILPLSPLSTYLGGDGGLDTFRPSELEMMMMASRSNHSNFLKDLHHRQELMDRQHGALSYMEKAAMEVRMQALREEINTLKMVNSHLTNRLVLQNKANYAAAGVGHSGLNLGPDPGYDMNSALNAMERMVLDGEGSEEGRQQAFEDDVENPGPASFVDFASMEEKESVVPLRVSLPKSISVRSDGYLKTAQTGESSGVKATKVT